MMKTKIYKDINNNYNGFLYSESENEYGTKMNYYHACCHGKSKEKLIEEIEYKRKEFNDLFDEMINKIRNENDL